MIFSLCGKEASFFMSLPCLIASSGVKFRMEIKNPMQICVVLEQKIQCVRLYSMDNNNWDS